MAKLNFKYATMNSGKTLDLIRTAYNYEENGYKVLILKPLIDTKGGNKITSRVGVEKTVDFFIGENDSVLGLLKDKLENVQCIFIDEAQFLNSKQVDELFYIAKIFDIDVICYGLRTNFQMNAFEGSRRLLELSDELEELKTICSCGNIARFVGRQIDDEYVLEGDEVIIDGTSNVKYIPLCGDCYLTKVKKLEKKK